MKWLKAQQIIIIVDFELQVRIKYEILRDKEYIKEKRKIKMYIIKKGEIRFS